MVVVEKTAGTKLDYQVNGNVVSFRNGELSLDLSKYEQDDPKHIDICLDENNCLVIGTAKGNEYAAQIDIPARQYQESEVVDDTNSIPGRDRKGIHREPIAFNIDRCTITLWGKEITE